MTDFSDLVGNTRINNIVVQHTLRQLDEHTLSVALVEMAEEHRQIIYRNMSKRAYDLLKKSVEEMEEREGAGSRDAGGSGTLGETRGCRQVRAIHAAPPRGGGAGVAAASSY